MAWEVPWMLAVSALLFVVWLVLVLKDRRQRRNGLPDIEPRLASNLMNRVNRKRVWWRRLLGITGLVLLSIAAAGPQIGTRVKPVERKGVDLVFAIDVSLSMNAEDVKPSRLEKAKFEVSQMIKQLKGDRVGIIVFAGSSHLYLPLTSDYEAAQLFLDAIDTDMIPTQGTALSSALNSGLSTFQSESEKYKVLVLVTDGEDHEGAAVDIARQAAETGIVIHTVGVGSILGSLIPVEGEKGKPQDYKRDPQGKLVTSKLNESILRDIANAGQGIFVRFVNRYGGYRDILQAIDRMEKKTISTHEFAEYEHRYRSFAGLALLCWLGAFLLPTKRPSDETWRGRIV